MVQRLNQRRQYAFNNETLTELHGRGVKDFVTGLPRALVDRPKILNDLIHEKEGVMIKSISVCRQGIYSIFQSGLNFLTLGQLKKKMQELGYDKLYHLYVVITFEDNERYYIEKNQRVVIHKFEGVPDNAECTEEMEYNYKDLKAFIETLEAKQIPGIYRYSSFDKNCQHFAYNLLNANGISQFNEFILQDVSQLAPSFIKYAANFITDIAGVADYMYRGGSYDALVDGEY